MRSTVCSRLIRLFNIFTHEFFKLPSIRHLRFTAMRLSLPRESFTQQICRQSYQVSRNSFQMPILRTLFSAKEMMGRCMMLRELVIQTFVILARQMKTHISSLIGLRSFIQAWAHSLIHRPLNDIFVLFRQKSYHRIYSLLCN